MKQMNRELYHYGILGMKWGVRRYQNPDGTLTAAGRERYSSSDQDRIFKNSTKSVFGGRQFTGDDPELKAFTKTLDVASKELNSDVIDYLHKCRDIINNSWKDPKTIDYAKKEIGNPDDYDDQELLDLIAYEAIDYSCGEKIKAIQKPVQDKIDQYTREVNTVVNDMVGRYGNTEVRVVNEWVKYNTTYRDAVTNFVATCDGINSYYNSNIADYDYGEDLWQELNGAADNLIAELRRSYK